MKTTLYILCIFTIFVSVIIASESDWMGRYPDREKSRLLAVLTKEFDDWQVELHSRESVDFICDNKNIVAVQDVLKDTSKSPLEMYNILIETLHPEFAELSKEYYKEQRDSSKVPDEFCEFDAKFYKGLSVLTGLLFHEIDWDKHKDHSSKEEVMCEAAFFFGLIDFERAITCLDAAPPVPLTCKIFSNFVADMYFGEAKRQDFSYEGDAETRKWLDDMVKKYQAGWHQHTTSLMRRFTRNIRGKVDDKLWADYLRAMMTAHLSAVLLWISEKEVKDLYEYIADNHIHDEYMFASRELDPSEHKKPKPSGHVFLRTFKLDPSGETATMGIINSGYGIHFHDSKSFELSELPDTISRDRRDVSVNRYIPFVVYDEVPRSDWGPAYIITDSMSKAYFERKQKKHEFSEYKKWQYIDYQRAGTCSVMSLWSGLYWFERESQQNLESFRLALYLEVLKEAAKELGKLRKELREMGDQIFEMADDTPGKDKLQKEIDEKSETEDDYLRFFSVGFNSAIRSIRYLHSDPSEQGLDMTVVMQDYADFYESQGDEKYWQLVKPNIDSLFHSTYLRVIKPMIWVTPLNLPKISTKERDCINEMNQAIKSKNPFNFVKAVISGTDLKCQSKKFLASIHFGVDELVLQTHHQDLILRALTKEVRSFDSGRLSILRLVHRLINEYGFKLFPTYSISPNATIDFTENIYRIVMFEDDSEMKQFAVNCAAFDLLAKNVLAAAYDLVEPARKALPDLATPAYIVNTEEYKLHKNLVQHVTTELQSMNPHIYAQYLASLIWNAGQTGIADYIEHFKPSEGWNRDDYSLLEHATKGGGTWNDSIRRHIDKFYNLMVGRELASKHLPSLPINLPDIEYICAGAVSRAIDANSPLGLVRAVAPAVSEECKNELFLSSITLGIEALKLQPHHQDLILQELIRHEDAPQILGFVNDLITKHGFKLFLTDRTPPVEVCRSYFHLFFLLASKLGTEDDARQLAANANRNISPASVILALCAKHSDLTELRSRFVDHTFRELQAMNPRLQAHHLNRLINQKALKPEDFNSVKFPKEWDDYDYVLIESAVISNPQREEYDKIFNFPKEYHIDTENVRNESEFMLMGANPSDDTLKEYATMLFNKMKNSYRK